MSVCQSPEMNTESLPRCEHNIALKFGCAFCNRNGCDCLCHLTNQFMCLNCGFNHIDGSGIAFVKKQETIAIKKELWDEMLEYKKLVDAHEKYLRKIDTIAMCDPEKVIADQKYLNERIDNLVSVINLSQKNPVTETSQKKRCNYCDNVLDTNLIIHHKKTPDDVYCSIICFEEVESYYA